MRDIKMACRDYSRHDVELESDGRRRDELRRRMRRRQLSKRSQQMPKHRASLQIRQGLTTPVLHLRMKKKLCLTKLMLLMTKATLAKKNRRRSIQKKQIQKKQCHCRRHHQYHLSLEDNQRDLMLGPRNRRMLVALAAKLKV